MPHSGAELTKRFPWRVFRRFITIQTILILGALGASGLAARHFFKRQFVSQTENQLKQTLVSIAHALPAEVPQGWCAEFSDEKQMRLTIIRKDGVVTCDSHHVPGSMDNHISRPEVSDGFRLGQGASVRFSQTLQQDMLYVALAVHAGQFILRGAIPLSLLQQSLHAFDASLIVFLVLIAVVLALFAVHASRELFFPLGRVLARVHRISALPSDARPSSAEAAQQEQVDQEDLGKEAYGEWSDLESSLDDIQHELREKVESLLVEREQQATLMAAISDAIVAVDLEGTALFYNTRFAMLMGNGQMARSKRLWELIRDPEVLEAFQRALKEGKAERLNAVAFETEEGQSYYSISITPLRKGRDQIYGAVGIFHDVSALKRAEQIRIDFVANVSHELRTPLTAIKGYTDTILQDVRGGRPPEASFLEVVARNAERLLSLINDLLDLSSLESNETFQKQTLDTQSISSQVIEHLQGEISSKSQKISLRVDAPSVSADPGRLEQVLVNLIGNANKYTPAGGSITVSWERGKNGSVLLKVRDTGPGIPVEHHARLFERFYRVDKARSREQGGTGLGLAIVKHIMQRHGGSVSITSKMGEGSEFICEFPA